MTISFGLTGLSNISLISAAGSFSTQQEDVFSTVLSITDQTVRDFDLPITLSLEDTLPLGPQGSNQRIADIPLMDFFTYNGVDSLRVMQIGARVNSRYGIRSRMLVLDYRGSVGEYVDWIIAAIGGS